MATLELIICGLIWAFAAREVMEDVIWKVMGLSVLFWIITGWQPLLKSIMDGFIEAGLLAGGGIISRTDFTDPGNIVDFGMSATAVVLANLGKLSFWNYTMELLLSGVTCWVIVGFYCIIAAQIFKAILEFYLVGVCSFFLLPFLAFQKTAFIGERVFGTMIAHGVQLMFLALILNVALPVLYTFPLPLHPTLDDCIKLLATSLILLTLALGAPSIANGMVFGSPSLHAGQFLQTAKSFTQTGGALLATGTGLSLLGAAAIRSGITGASAMGTAASRGATNARATGGNQVAGGLRGIQQYVTGRTIQGFRNAINNGRVRARRHVP